MAMQIKIATTLNKSMVVIVMVLEITKGRLH